MTVSLVVSACALFVSLVAWRVADTAARVSLYEKRLEIYTAAERFIQSWQRDQQLDQDSLVRLMAAWNRSHFLCRPAVTTYLQALWLEGLEVANARRVLDGDAEGDKEQAEASYRKGLRRLTDTATLRQVFDPELRVSTLLPLLRLS